MYWIWQNARSHDHEARIAGRPPALADLGEWFDRGVKVQRPVPCIRMTRDADSQGTLTDNLIASGTSGLVFSSRLRTVLTNVGVTNIDYYPFVLDNPRDGTSTADYTLANLLGRFACFDLAKSEFQTVPNSNEIEFIDSLVLDESALAKLDGVRMFRSAEHAHVIVVHDTVRAACVNAGITGVKFVLAANFSL